MLPQISRLKFLSGIFGEKLHRKLSELQKVIQCRLVKVFQSDPMQIEGNKTLSQQ
jgi:hypothetical protein